MLFAASWWIPLSSRLWLGWKLWYDLHWEPKKVSKARLDWLIVSHILLYIGSIFAGSSKCLNILIFSNNLWCLTLIPPYILVTQCWIGPKILNVSDHFVTKSANGWWPGGNKNPALIMNKGQKNPGNKIIIKQFVIIALYQMFCLFFYLFLFLSLLAFWNVSRKDSKSNTQLYICILVLHIPNMITTINQL